MNIVIDSRHFDLTVTLLPESSGSSHWFLMRCAFLGVYSTGAHLYLQKFRSVTFVFIEISVRSAEIVFQPFLHIVHRRYHKEQLLYLH